MYSENSKIITSHTFDLLSVRSHINQSHARGKLIKIYCTSPSQIRFINASVIILWFKLFVVECRNAKLELIEKDDSIKFNLRAGDKMSSLMGDYQYQLDYDGRPVFKQSGGKERYLYWSAKNDEWMVTSKMIFRTTRFESMWRILKIY